jgi:phosphatidylglycerophosphate synthase
MLRLDWSTTMEFSALFLAVTVVMLVAWWGTRTLALALFAATLLASIATYLHHASDVLKLSF